MTSDDLHDVLEVLLVLSLELVDVDGRDEDSGDTDVEAVMLVSPPA